MNRRQLISVLGGLPAPGLAQDDKKVSSAWRYLHHRQLGRTGRWVVPLGLGGQGALQWTPEGVDPVEIVLRAIQLGVNYLDTANAYGPSQRNYGRAFWRMNLIPGTPRFNAALRGRLYLASKTAVRFAKDPARPGVPTAIDELKQSLSAMFGDGKGSFPRGAYLDCIQLHNVRGQEDVDQIFEGMADRGGAPPERIGALAGLLDFRDGTNYTGLNPEHRILVQHIGITGHKSSAVLMDALRRDTENVIDTLLVALNANERHYCCHQNNVLPVALAKGMGVIAMKVFADGVFYGKPPRFSKAPEDVIQSVGAEKGVPPQELIRYPLSLPGVSCAITGIGHINREEPEDDQVAVNLSAAVSDLATELERVNIERHVRSVHGTRTNYFQDADAGLVQPGNVTVEKDDDRVRVLWDTALAGGDKILSYVVLAGDKDVLRIPFRPQTTPEPLSAVVPASAVGGAPVTVLASNLPPWFRREQGAPARLPRPKS